jgi:hypothetical protein
MFLLIIFMDITSKNLQAISSRPAFSVHLSSAMSVQRVTAKHWNLALIAGLANSGSPIRGETQNSLQARHEDELTRYISPC